MSHFITPQHNLTAGMQCYSPGQVDRLKIQLFSTVATRNDSEADFVRIFKQYVSEEKAADVSVAVSAVLAGVVGSRVAVAVSAALGVYMEKENGEERGGERGWRDR